VSTFELEVEPLEDGDEEVALRFKTIGEARVATQVKDRAEWVSVMGIGEGGARETAHVVLVEDSSEGTAALVYGGRHGLDLEGRREAYLVLAPDAVR
jgi:hypothetical protein